MRILYFTIFILLGLNCQSQLKLSGNIKRSEKQAIVFNVPYSNWVHEENDHIVVPDSNGDFEITLPILKPQFFFLRNGKKFIYLYGEPGQTLIVNGSMDNLVNTISFGGKLGNENTLRHKWGLSHYELGSVNSFDTAASPGNILTGIKNRQIEYLKRTKDLNFKTSVEFRQMLYADIRYFAAAKIWQLLWDQEILSTSFNDQRKREEWLEVLRKAHDGLSISDDSAIGSFYYQQMISYYPRFSQFKYNDGTGFRQFVSSITGKTFDEALKEIKSKGEEYWGYTIYDKTLTGKSREAMLAAFLIKCLYTGELSFQQEAFQKFERDFPNGKYLEDVSKKMIPYLQSIAEAGSGNNVFDIDTTNYNYKHLDSVLIKHKGRVVYIDLWGTWCGPCREQFRYVDDLKKRFRGRPVDFLYIASEHRANPEKYWREMIHFYKLSGRHLLMNKEMEKYFMDLYSKTGSFRFPSYILADKSGKIIDINAAQPSDREKLYTLIEKYL